MIFYYFSLLKICVTVAESQSMPAKMLCVYRDFQPQVGQVWRKVRKEENRTFNDAWAESFAFTSDEWLTSRPNLWWERDLQLSVFLFIIILLRVQNVQNVFIT